MSQPFWDAGLAAFTSCDRPLGKLLSCLCAEGHNAEGFSCMRAEGRNAFSAGFFQSLFRMRSVFLRRSQLTVHFCHHSLLKWRLFLNCLRCLHSEEKPPKLILCDAAAASTGNAFGSAPMMPKAKPLVMTHLAMPLSKLVVMSLTMPVIMPLAMPDAELLAMLQHCWCYFHFLNTDHVILRRTRAGMQAWLRACRRQCSGFA